MSAQNLATPVSKSGNCSQVAVESSRYDFLIFVSSRWILLNVSNLRRCKIYRDGVWVTNRAHTRWRWTGFTGFLITKLTAMHIALLPCDSDSRVYRWGFKRVGPPCKPKLAHVLYHWKCHVCLNRNGIMKVGRLCHADFHMKSFGVLQVERPSTSVLLWFRKKQHLEEISCDGPWCAKFSPQNHSLNGRARQILKFWWGVLPLPRDVTFSRFQN